MSVLVKGMKLPESCNVCEFAHWSTLDQMAYCKAKNYTMCPPDYREKRADFCPLVALPDHHGDLIDRDALKEDLRMGKECDKDCPTDWKACHYDRVYAKQDFCEWLDDADVVIEAEDG